MKNERADYECDTYQREKQGNARDNPEHIDAVRQRRPHAFAMLWGFEPCLSEYSKHKLDLDGPVSSDHCTLGQDERGIEMKCPLSRRI